MSFFQTLNKKSDLTTVPIRSGLLMFALPVIFSTLLQNAFHMADKIVLGQMAGITAQAAVGACSTPVHIVVQFFSGLSTGVSVVLARFLGQGDTEKTNKVINTSMIFSLICGVVAAILAVPLADPLLQLCNTKEEYFQGALVYLQIYFASIPVVMVYNFGSKIMITQGDSYHPTLYVIIGGVANIILNIILCLVLTQKEAAVSLATLASNLISAVLIVRRLYKDYDFFTIIPKKAQVDFPILGKVIRFGIPSAINASLLGIANLQVNAAINEYGVYATAGHSAAITVEGLVGAFDTGFCTAVTPFVGQNLGANKPQRVKETIFWGSIYGAVVVQVLSLIVYAFRVPILNIFTPGSMEAINYGISRFNHVLLLYGICGLFSALSHVLIGFGYSSFTSVTSILSTVVFRSIWMQLIYPLIPTFDNIMLCYTIAWSINLVSYSIFLFFVYRRYQRGIYRKI